MILLTAPALSSAHSESSELKPWHEGAPPRFTLSSSNGADVTLEAQRGRVVLVHFFATWCEPCRKELPALRRFVERAGQSPVGVLAVSVAEADLRVRAFLETTPVNFPVLLDRDRAIAKAWNVSTLPSTVILDPHLKPRLVVESDYNWDRIQPKALIDTLSETPIPDVNTLDTK